MVVGIIRELEFEMSPQKTEAMWFCHSARWRNTSAGKSIMGEEAEILVETQMKYLDLTLDHHWSFVAHFGRLVP